MQVFRPSILRDTHCDETNMGEPSAAAMYRVFAESFILRAIGRLDRRAQARLMSACEGAPLSDGRRGAGRFRSVTIGDAGTGRVDPDDLAGPKGKGSRQQSRHIRLRGCRRGFHWGCVL